MPGIGWPGLAFGCVTALGGFLRSIFDIGSFLLLGFRKSERQPPRKATAKGGLGNHVLATLPTATNAQPVFSLTNLVILVILGAIFYPLQKKLRESVSRRRRERWAEEDRLAELEREERDRPAVDG